MANNFELMPVSLSRKLQGLTVNEALNQGILNHVGDDEGNFIFSENENPDNFFAVVQNFIIPCSENVVNSNVPIESIAGGLVFYRHILNGEETVKLGMPNNVKLGKVVFQINKG